jgi:16S rRNA (guanine527-N7)-methyltransferase
MTGVEEPAAPFTEEGAAAAVFTDRVELAGRFVEHLVTSGVERGLIGPREVPRIWTRHVLNCAVIEEHIPGNVAICDVGSGAGLPGIALALARPDLDVTLVEPLLRRVTWLQEVVDDLGLDRVRVLRGRAEDMADQVRVDVAVARAVAPLSGLAAWCLPLLRPGGRLLAIKGRSAAEELDAGRTALTRLGARSWRIVLSGEAVLQEPTTVVEVVAGAAAGPGQDGPGRAGSAGSGRRPKRRGKSRR